MQYGFKIEKMFFYFARKVFSSNDIYMKNRQRKSNDSPDNITISRPRKRSNFIKHVFFIIIVCNKKIM